MNAKYAVAVMLLVSASAMAAPENSRIGSFIESYQSKSPASAAAQKLLVQDGPLPSVDEKLERALEEQLMEDASADLPVIELTNEEDDIADAWPIPGGDKVASTY